MTGDASLARCQPCADSLAKRTDASLVPPRVQRLPTWTPVLRLDLKNSRSVATAARFTLNLVPTVTVRSSTTEGTAGRARADQIDEVVAVTACERGGAASTCGESAAREAVTRSTNAAATAVQARVAFSGC